MAAVIEHLDDYLVIDVECPNCSGTSVCAFGYAVVKGGKVVDHKLNYVNPEEAFDSISPRLNGVQEYQVKNAKTIAELWTDEVKELFENNFIVGHNATYQLEVLGNSLKRYGIELPNVFYACTMELSLKHFNSVSYRLSSIAKQCGIGYKEHNPLSTIQAAGRLFEYMKEQKGLDIDVLKKYSRQVKLAEKIDADMCEQLNVLHGLIKGITVDGIVEQDEIKLIDQWATRNVKYRDQAPFNEIYAGIEEVLEDNIVYSHEINKLLEISRSTVESKHYNKTLVAIQVLRGLLAGLAADGKIKNNEVDGLHMWLKDYDYMSGVHAYDEIASLLHEILEDGVLDNDERDQIMALCKEIEDSAYLDRLANK